MRQLAMVERMCASPGMFRATTESNLRIDVRAILPTLSAPTLVIHARDDLVPVQNSRYLADHIPGARYLEVDGADHAPWFTEPDTILTEIEEFLTGSHAAPPQSHRALRTVLFTDIVASTQHAAATGDERWRAVLHRFGEITAELTQRFGGTVVKSTGDGHLATFDGPTQAIRCAETLRADAETLGIQIRAGIHTGECELLDNDIGGIAVHIAARICGQAGADDILVSRTVRDLVVGSCTGFEDRGSVELRGVPGTWQLLAVDRHGARADRPRQSWHQCRPPTADRDAAPGPLRDSPDQRNRGDRCSGRGDRMAEEARVRPDQSRRRADAPRHGVAAGVATTTNAAAIWSNASRTRHDESVVVGLIARRSSCARRWIRCRSNADRALVQLNSTCRGFGGGAGLGGGDGEQLGGQALNLALGGGGIDQGVGPFQGRDALHGHGGVIDRAMKRGGGGVVFLGHLGAVTDLGYQLLLTRTTEVLPQARALGFDNTAASRATATIRGPPGVARRPRSHTGFPR